MTTRRSFAATVSATAAVSADVLYYHWLLVFIAVAVGQVLLSLAEAFKLLLLMYALG